MSRRGVVQRRPVPADSVYNSRLISMIIRRIMRSGKKSQAARIVYEAMQTIGEKTGAEPLEIFEKGDDERLKTLLRSESDLALIKKKFQEYGTYVNAVEANQQAEFWNGTVWQMAPSPAVMARWKATALEK